MMVRGFEGESGDLVEASKCKERASRIGFVSWLSDRPQSDGWERQKEPRAKVRNGERTRRAVGGKGPCVFVANLADGG